MVLMRIIRGLVFWLFFLKFIIRPAGCIGAASYTALPTAVCCREKAQWSHRRRAQKHGLRRVNLHPSPPPLGLVRLRIWLPQPFFCVNKVNQSCFCASCRTLFRRSRAEGRLGKKAGRRWLGRGGGRLVGCLGRSQPGQVGRSGGGGRQPKGLHLEQNKLQVDLWRLPFPRVRQ